MRRARSRSSADSDGRPAGEAVAVAADKQTDTHTDTHRRRAPQYLLRWLSGEGNNNNYFSISAYLLYALLLLFRSYSGCITVVFLK